MIHCRRSLLMLLVAMLAHMQMLQADGLQKANVNAALFVYPDTLSLNDTLKKSCFARHTFYG